MIKPFCRPVSPFKINQKFGENNACVSTDGSNKVVYCDGNNPPNGYKSLYGSIGHKGLDLRAISGQPVYNSLSGIITFMDTNPKSGLDVRVESTFNGDKYLHIYEHLLGHNTLKIGQEVRTGYCLGWADNTGYSSGDHLHFELKKLINNEWVSIDPLPLMNEYFARDADKLRGLIEKVIVLAESLIDRLRKV